MSHKIPQLSAEDAKDMLSSHLTEMERAKVLDIYKDISSEIRWGRVLTELFPNWLDAMQDVLFGLNDFKSNRYVKRNPWTTLKFDQALFEDEDEKSMARRHLLLLYMTKKLLGIAKTKVNQEMAEIPTLTPHKESDLLDIIQRAEEEEEEQLMAREVEVVALLEAKLIPNLAPEGDCRQNGRHVRTEVRYRRNNELLYRQQYCKDCRQVTESQVLDKGEKKAKGPCKHPGAEWVEGKEGQEAICTECKKPIPNPETYQWKQVGLEPYGDNPAKDEVIVLCSAY